MGASPCRSAIVRSGDWPGGVCGCRACIIRRRNAIRKRRGEFLARRDTCTVGWKKSPGRNKWALLQSWRMTCVASSPQAMLASYGRHWWPNLRVLILMGGQRGGRHSRVIGYDRPHFARTQLEAFGVVSMHSGITARWVILTPPVVRCLEAHNGFRTRDTGNA